MGKNITKSAIDWVKLLKLVPPEEKLKFYSFKAKSDAYLRRVIENPATPPPIEWAAFEKSIPDKSLVSKFKSEYESYKVPYPEDKYSAEVDKQWASLQPEIKSYCESMQAHIEKANTELKRIKSLPKFDEMTMEMYREMYPDEALDPVNKPSFWPHTKDEQLGYKDPTVKAEGGH